MIYILKISLKALWDQDIIMRVLIGSKGLFLAGIISLLVSIGVTEAFFRGHTYFTGGDDVTPLSSAVIYNFRPYFSDLKGGEIVSPPSSLQFIILNIYSNPFKFLTFKYGELISTIFYLTLGNFGLINFINNYYNINSRLYSLKRLTLLYGIVLVFYNTTQGIGQVMGLAVSMIPIFGIFPWLLYSLYKVFVEKNLLRSIIFGTISILLYYIFVANTYFIIVNIPLAFFLSFFTLSLLFLIKELRFLEKMFRLFILIVIQFIVALPYFIYVTTTVAPLFKTAHTSSSIAYDLTFYFVHGVEAELIKTLTLTYTLNVNNFPKSEYIYLGSAPYFASHEITIIALVIPILIFLPLLLKKYNGRFIISSFLYLLYAGWFSAPYFLQYYVELVSKIEVLWSLNIPEAVFPYLLTLSATLALAYVLILLLKNKLNINFRILVSILLLMAIIINIYPFIKYSGGGFSLPSAVYEITNIIDNSNIYNPRVLISPSSFIYLWYNWTEYGDGQYVGAGFWDTIIKGDTFGYYQSGPPLVGFVTLYQSNMSSPVIYSNALKLLGINYVIYTNTSVQRTLTFTGTAAQIPTLNISNLRMINKTLNEYSLGILLNSQGFTLYHYSNSAVVYIPQYAALSPSIYSVINNDTSLNILYNLLSNTEVNWENAAVICYSSTNIIHVLNLYPEYESVNSHISINKLSFNTSIYNVTGENPDHFTAILRDNDAGLIPIVVRYPYDPMINNSDTYLLGEDNNVIVRPLLVGSANFGSATVLLFNITHPGVYTLHFSLAPRSISPLQFLHYYNEVIDGILLIILIVIIFVAEITSRYKKTKIS
jgi:hypothetical protein